MALYTKKQYEIPKCLVVPWRLLSKANPDIASSACFLKKNIINFLVNVSVTTNTIINFKFTTFSIFSINLIL